MISKKKVLKCIENNKAHHHEMKLAQTDHEPPPKKHLPTSPVCFFLMEPQTPQLPNRNPLAPGPVSWRHGTVDFDTTTTWELWSSSAHRP